jgi:hypothetical protein
MLAVRHSRIIHGALRKKTIRCRANLIGRDAYIWPMRMSTA